MALFRLYAYPVEPQRTVDDKDFVEPVGSRIEVTDELEGTLQAELAAAQSMTPVDLRRDPGPKRRTSPVRDPVINFVF